VKRPLLLAVLVGAHAGAPARAQSPPDSTAPAAPAAPTASPSSPASPEPSPSASPAADERLRKVQERRVLLERELAGLRGQERSLLGEVERLELEVRVRGEQLRETQLVLQRTQQQMDATQRRVKTLEHSIAETRPLLAAHARALYKLGELSYLRMLLSVDRPSDFFRGYRFVTALARRDNERIRRFREDLTALAATRGELEKRSQEALGLRAQLERTRRSLDGDRRRKTELLRSIVEKKETHAAYVQELEEAETRLRNLLAGLGDEEVAVPVAAFRGTLAWPCAGRVRVPYGRRKHPRFDTYTVQNGIEIEAPLDTPVHAVHDGTVVFADRFRGYGLMLVVDHGSKHHSLYAHLGEIRVTNGQKVAAGELLGTIGGSSLDGPGLYFEMRFQGRPVDPGEWLRRDGR
jgi:septal ring factor EnvC (AmiA/AmiB activator)